MCVLLGVLRNSRAIPIMNPLPWFMIDFLFYMFCFSFINMDIQFVSYLCKCVSIANIQYVYIKIS